MDQEKEEKIFDCLVFFRYVMICTQRKTSLAKHLNMHTPILCLFLIFILQNQSRRVSHSICTDPFKFEKC